MITEDLTTRDPR